MNRKIFGIIVCILLMTSYITIAENIDKTSATSSFKKISNASVDNVPIWDIGDSWSYKVENMAIDFEQGGQYIHLILETNKLQLKVNEVRTETYIVEINADVSGSGNIYVDLGDGPVNITLKLKDTTLIGTVVFNKTDLGIKQLNPILSGRVIVDVIEQPYVEVNLPPIPIRVTMNITLDDLSNPISIINFPLEIGNIWGINSTNISIDGTIKSPWLYLMYFVNNLARRHWNLTMIIANQAGVDEATAQKISDMLLDILPIINISYVLQKYLEIGNVFDTPEIPTILLCNSFEEINVQGKPYNAYNISVIGGLGNIYYAPSAGNIVKISGHFKDIIPFISDLNIELMETNFQP